MKWAVNDMLARGSRPGYELGNIDVPRKVVDDWIEVAQKAGIRSIICLLDEQHLVYYRDLAGGLIEYYRQQGFQVAHVRVKDHQDPPIPPEQLTEIEVAYQRLEKPVLVHCSAGMDRTGSAIRLLRRKPHAAEQ